MRFHKIISTVLHPIVIPTMGVLLYFIFVSHTIPKNQQFLLLSLVFGVTYIVPLLTLVLLKALNFIEDFQVKTIKERRFPVIFMIILFFLLGDILVKNPALRDLGFLFYGTALSLFCIYLLFYFNIKSSLHLVSMGNAVSFFLIISTIHNSSMLPVIMILIL